MTSAAPERSPEPVPDDDLVRLTHALDQMRNALLELSWVMRDYLFEQDSAQRDQAAIAARQVIHSARTRDANRSDAGDQNGRAT
ncbi:MAG: hypothetical protein K9K38_07680 [Rhodoferax sp.]|nr:hypothetical protein [Rhodoferax sp.]